MQWWFDVLEQINVLESIRRLSYWEDEYTCH